MDPLIGLLLSVVLIILAGFFAMAETAFSCFNKYRFQAEAEEGKKMAKIVLWVDKHNDSSLITILIGINAASVVLSAIFTSLFLRWITGIDDWVVSIIATIVLTLILYFFSETLPKQIARKIPNACVKMCALPLSVFIILLFPLSTIFRIVTFLLNKLFPSRHNHSLTEDDFTHVLETNEKGGLLEENESDLIQASFDFADTSVKEVLTPRRKIFAISLKGLSASELAEKLCSTRFSRVPVYYESVDKVVGVIIVAKYLDAYRKNPNLKIQELVEKPYFVSPRVHMDDLVEGFNAGRTQMAIVKKNDEVLGLITMEDVLEELIGPMGERLEEGNRGEAQ